MHRARSWSIGLVGACFGFWGLLLIVSGAFADTLDLQAEFNYFTSNLTTTYAGGSAEAEAASFKQRYNLNLSKNLYPYLTFYSGANFSLEEARSDTEGDTSEFETRTVHPFARFALQNPVFSAGVGYSGNFVNQNVSGVALDRDNRQDRYDGFVAWNFEKLPSLQINFSQTHAFDNLDTQDTLNKALFASSHYTAFKRIQVDYAYNRFTKDDLLRAVETLDQSHNANVRYADTFFDGRLSVGSAYQVSRNTFEFPGKKSIDAPLLRSAGFSATDNFPADGALSVNTAVIDGDTSASAGPDIGLDADENTQIAIGLDFGLTVQVDTLNVWVDRALDPSVASDFTWSVYTSADNTDTSTWALVAVLPAAAFGTSENRFTIPFTPVTTRFIKVVTQPLSASAANAALFPNIFITEMQALVTVTGVKVRSQNTSIAHNYSFNLGAKLSARTFLGYNLGYQQEERELYSGAESTRSALSNNINVNHTFNSMFTAASNLTQAVTIQDGDEPVTSYTYSASLRAVYLPTLYQTLSYSGSRTMENQGTKQTEALFLRTSALLYQGWNAFVDTGIAWNRDPDMPAETNNSLRIGSNIAPNEKISLNVGYDFSTTDSDRYSGGRKSSSALNVRLSVVPVRSLSLNAAWQWLEEGETKRSLQSYSANWAPFPEGALQLFTSYNETFYPESETRKRSFSPGLKWLISRHIFLDLFYSMAETRTPVQTTESTGLNFQLRLVL